MSGPYEHPSNIPPSEQYDPNYGMYNTQFGGSYPNVSGPPTSFDQVAFWYRPESSDSMYPPEASPYGQGISTQGTQMDSQSGIKHRRTRSGCFTCRSRRVKCDETRPVCDRCRKGNRECEYPPHTSSSKRQKSGDARSLPEGSSKDDSKLDTIIDESAPEEEDDNDDEDFGTPSPTTTSSRPALEKSRTLSALSTSRRQKQRQRSDASLNTREKARPPSTEPSEPVSELQSPASVELASNTSNTSTAETSRRWKTLKPDLKPEIVKYLQFQRDHMTYYHYFFKLDPTDFIHNEFIDLALQYEPLLYAVVAFASYHHTLRLPEDEANFNLFWRYYCKSIMSLRKWLEKHRERNEAVLLTVLQLAAFEEYLGDWPNLFIHHRAAHSILITLYTPETVTKTASSRMIFDWYVRFDVISGIMAVRDAVLGRDWLATVQAWYENKAQSEASDTTALLESIISSLRLIGFDIAHLIATASNVTSQDERELLQSGDTDFINRFMTEISKLSARMDDLRQQIEHLNDTHLTETDVAMPAIDEDDTFDPHIPLFRDALWPLNFVWIDWYAVEQLLKYQTFVFLQKVHGLRQQSNPQQTAPPEPQLPPELSKLSSIQCQIYEAVERASRAPAGAVLGCQSSLGLSVVFLPKPPPASNEKYIMWARRKLANVEKLGYVWPPHFRQRMAQIWGIPEIEDWWLPNNEGKFRLLDEIRMVVEERNKAAADQMRRTGKDDGGSGLREIKALFDRLEVTTPTGSKSSETGEGFRGDYRFSVSSTSEAENSGGSIFDETTSGTGVPQ